jgi:type IV fimbrial biogenesis protein FimT
MTAHPQKGFTLIEAILTLAVAGVLLSLAVPSFSAMSKNNRISSQTNDFISSLSLARSQALARVSRVTVCRSSNGTACAGSGGWEQGWIVFADDDNDATVDNSEEILRVYSALDGNNTLRGSTNVAAYISYVSGGTTRLTNGTFQSGSVVLCDDRGAGAYAREINVSVTGRSRVESSAPVSCNP